jgi:hypothetical protein
MQKILFIVLILVLGIASADARRGYGHRHYDRLAEPDSLEQTAPSLREGPPSERNGAMPPARLRAEGADDDIARLIPDWQLAPAEPNWKGRRYISPDGSAWIAVYASQVGEETVTAHMKGIAFVEGEQITYLRGERDWIVVSGLKDARVFYRKAALACRGLTWHHVAFEYAVDAKRKMDGLVTRLSRALDKFGNAGCQPNVSPQ